MFEENINDVEIGNIDFQWVEKQTKTNFLKRALKILELDGKKNYKFGGPKFNLSYKRWVFS